MRRKYSANKRIDYKTSASKAFFQSTLLVATTLFVLQNARHDYEKEHVKEHGPYISSILYQAKDVQRAWDDALWAGMIELQAPEHDPMTGLLTAHLKEPCGGNQITLTERYTP